MLQRHLLYVLTLNARKVSTERSWKLQSDYTRWYPAHCCGIWEHYYVIKYESMWWLFGMVRHYILDWWFHDNDGTYGIDLHFKCLLIKKLENIEILIAFVCLLQFYCFPFWFDEICYLPLGSVAKVTHPCITICLTKKWFVCNCLLQFYWFPFDWMRLASCYDHR
jgi:hypothetical protein